jgi:phosphoenolpyruvate-protein kinase (PTS system EI component)
VAVPEVKRIIRSVTMDQVREVAQQAIMLSTGKEVEKFARRKLKELVPDVATEVD